LRRAHPPHRPLRPPALSLESQPPPPFTPRSRRLIEEPGRIGRSPGARSAGVSCRGRAEVLGGRATGVSARGLARVRASAARALPVARPPSSTVQAAPETSTWAGWGGQGANVRAVGPLLERRPCCFFTATLSASHGFPKSVKACLHSSFGLKLRPSNLKYVPTHRHPLNYSHADYRLWRTSCLRRLVATAQAQGPSRYLRCLACPKQGILTSVQTPRVSLSDGS